MAPAPLRVLVAEDSRSQRAVYVDMLRAEGFEVHEAEDGRVALDLCRMLHPDLLVLDLQLPRLSGQEVLTRVRSDHRIGATPVLVLTADERDSSLSRALDAGATDYVIKSLSRTELVTRVRRVLRVRAAT
jgi:DNA-binding response OmpR family regulator